MSSPKSTVSMARTVSMCYISPPPTERHLFLIFSRSTVSTKTSTFFLSELPISLRPLCSGTFLEMFWRAPPNFEFLLSQFHDLSPEAETKNFVYSNCLRVGLTIGLTTCSSCEALEFKYNLVSWAVANTIFHKNLLAIILLIGLRLVKGQCLHLSNLSSLEVEDIHCVHLNIIDVDF